MVWECVVCLLLLRFHQAEPFAVAEHSHDGVEAVEGGREWYAFVYVEHGAYQIHRQPQQPLLCPFVGQSPVGDDAQG